MLNIVININIIECKEKKYVKWKRAIVTAALHFKSLKIDLKTLHEEIDQENVLSYDNSTSKEFFWAIRQNDFRKVKFFIQNNDFLVYEFDEVNNNRLN